MGIEVDETKFPILVVNAFGDSSDEDLFSYIRALNRALRREKPHVVIVDATGGTSLKGTHRKLVAEWNKENQRDLSHFRKGLILVADSTLLRGMITAIYWIHPPPFPYYPVAELSEALTLASRLLNPGAQA